MTYTIIIAFCSLLLIAYIFNLTSSKTNIPSVILLLLLGWGINQITLFLNIELPEFDSVLPVIATIGLVLIVLEGSLELSLNKSKIDLVKKSLVVTVLPMAAMAVVLAFLFQYFSGASFKISLINAIPFCIISSAIAIPSARNLSEYNREFVTYESSLSDILGVLFFNFIVMNSNIDLHAFGIFGFKLALVIVVSFIATIGLSLLLSKIDHHVKFVPIILLVILIYAVSEIFHLPALIFIMIFGLTIGNLGEFRRIKWVIQFHTEELKNEIQKFKGLTIEGAFLIRALFFMLFGFMLETSEILNTSTLLWAAGIVILIFALRAIQLKLSKLEMLPLLFVAPRGLITILLFLAIEPSNNILLVNRSLIIQVIILSALIMTFGIMVSKKKEEEKKVVKA
jgi:potassium/hydrogen antiporter